MELRQLAAEPQLNKQPSIITALPVFSQAVPSPELRSVRMDRQDSGYSEVPTSPTSDSRRTSTSSTGKRSSQRSSSKSKRRSTNSSSTSNPSRPSTKRNSRSSGQPRTSNTGARPLLHARHTTPFTHAQPYQFFQFPSLADSNPPVPHTSQNDQYEAQRSHDYQDSTTQSRPLAALPSPPPTTVQYWTSDSTRRLEYAAIDAASRGVRGFFIRMVPDCILPAGSRRTKFHGEEDGDSDAGSVRRYRLALPDEAECEKTSGTGSGMKRGGSGRPRGLLRRWTSFGRGSGSGSAGRE